MYVSLNLLAASKVAKSSCKKLSICKSRISWLENPALSVSCTLNADNIFAAENPAVL